MKIIVRNATGSQELKATLHVQSGVIQFEDGEISHVSNEKQLNKTIRVSEEVAPVIQKSEQPKTLERSEKTRTEVSKTKLN